MSKPKRGDIVWVRLSDSSTGRGAEGTEIGNWEDPVVKTRKASEVEYRPCLVVSSDDYNSRKHNFRVTVAPFTTKEEQKISGMAVRAMEFNYDDDFIQARTWKQTRASKLLKRYKSSLVDFAQLWTVFVISDKEKRAYKKRHNKPLEYPNDAEWSHEYGRLHEDRHWEIDGFLDHVVYGPRSPKIVTRQPTLTHQRADVLAVRLPQWSKSDLPRPMRRSIKHLALVVSSVFLDAKRVHALGQLTVVPVLKTEDVKNDFGLVLVEVKTSGGSETLFAVCQEIYAIDWDERGATRVGTVEDMNDVNLELGDYLDIVPP